MLEWPLCTRDWKAQDVDQVAVSVDYAVQGEGALLALKAPKSRDTRIFLHIECFHVFGLRTGFLARPTQAWELQGSFLTHLLNGIHQT